MDDTEFQGWMKTLAGTDEGVKPAGANAIWWRAQLRRRLEMEELATRPVRIAECAAGTLCWILTAALSAAAGAGGLAVFFALTLGTAGGLRAIAHEKSQPLRK